MKAIPILISFFALSLNSFATEKGKIAAATSIAEITGIEEYKQVYQKSMLERIQPVFEKHNIDQKTQDRIRAIVLDTTNRLTEAELLGPYIDSYVQVFSLSELEGILDFFRSPAGRAMLGKKNRRIEIESEALAALAQQNQKEIIEQILKEIPQFQK